MLTMNLTKPKAPNKNLNIFHDVFEFNSDENL